MKSANPIDLCAATDAELVQFCRQGDQNAYGQIVERYQTLVCSIAYNRCGDLTLSEDLAQDAFMLAWQKLVDLKDASKFKAWICTIARNLAHRSSQRLRRSVAGTAVNLDAVVDFPSDVSSPLERSVSLEEEKLVWQALTDVPENYREPLILFYREEQSVKRVAAALDLSEVAVKQRLSRGRKMLQKRLAAVVESALADSKPTKTFTSAVLLGLTGITAKTATAAPVTKATATLAKSATGVGAGSGLSIVSLWPILKLHVVAWMLKVGFDAARSERERQLLRQYCFFSFCTLAFYVAALVSSHWWERFIEPAWLRSSLPGAMMVVFLAPVIVLGRRLGKQIERIRIEEETFTPPKPLVESDDNGPIASPAYTFFCLSSLFVVAGPAILSFVARDWLALSAIVATAIGLSLTAAQISLRIPNRSFQLFGAGTALTAMVTIGIMIWKQSVWASAFVDFFPWLVGTTSTLTMTLGIVTVIAWKRVHGR